MRVPVRKPGKYEGQKADPNLTRAKYGELSRRLERLKKISQPEAIKEVKRLAADGDFSENAAYQIAKGRLRGINRRIDEIESHLKRAEIIAPRGLDRVELGHQVTIESQGRIKTYTLLGPSETDPDRLIISHLSPLGSALLGKKIGDEIEAAGKNKNTKYKIIKIA